VLIKRITYKLGAKLQCKSIAAAGIDHNDHMLTLKSIMALKIDAFFSFVRAWIIAKSICLTGVDL
jgi:hypothetical protein